MEWNIKQGLTLETFFWAAPLGLGPVLYDDPTKTLQFIRFFD